MPTRTFTAAELNALGAPHELVPPSLADEYPNTGVELHQVQTETRRWVSKHKLVFRAPDDGKTYRVVYEQGLTEDQEDTDPWGNAPTIKATEVEQQPVTVMRWVAKP